MKKREFEFVSFEAEAKFLDRVYGQKKKNSLSRAKAAMLSARQSTDIKYLRNMVKKVKG